MLETAQSQFLFLLGGTINEKSQICFRFRRVLLLSLKSKCCSDATGRGMLNDEDEAGTEMLNWRKMR